MSGRIRGVRLYLQAVSIVLVGIMLMAAVPVQAAADPAQAGVGVSIGVGDTAVHFSGRTSPGAFITIKDNDRVIGTVIADGAGNYDKTYGAQTPGIHNVSVNARSSSGLVGDSTALSVNYREHDTTEVVLFLPTTIALSKTNIPPDTELLIRGETIPDGAVVLLIDQATTINVAADQSGNWERRIVPGELAVGNHSISVYVTDSGGRQSTPTAPRFFTMQADSPVSVVKPNRLAAIPARPTITMPRGNATATTGQITVAGLADARQQIEVWRNGRLLGSILSDERGGWSMPITLNPSINELTARACNDTGCSPYAAGVNITYTPAPDVPLTRLALSLGAYRYEVMAGQSVRIGVTARNGSGEYTYQIFWGDGSDQTVTGQDKITSFSHAYQAAGLYAGKVVVQDSSGQMATSYFSVRMTDGPARGRAATYIVIAGAAAAAAGLTMYAVTNDVPARVMRRIGGLRRRS